jgi:CarD family transcriptional regulator
MFQVGQKVVYPTHGVGRIEAIEQKEVSGSRQSYYILRILGNDMRIMVPTGNAERVGLRQLIGPKEVRKVMEILRKKDVEICPNWNRRFKDNLERIKTGSLYEVATVLRKLVLCRKSATCRSAGRRCWRPSTAPGGEFPRGGDGRGGCALHGRSDHRQGLRPPDLGGGDSACRNRCCASWSWRCVVRLVW